MKRFRERISPKSVMTAGAVFLAVLVCLTLFSPRLPNTASVVSAQWLPRGERIEVPLTGRFLDVDGKPVSFDQFADEILLLNFWATWCYPCLLEMPSMASLQEEFAKRGLRVVAVTEEDQTTVRQFVDQNPYPFTFLIDPSGQLTERLRVGALPLTIVLDRDRKLTYFHQGARAWDTPDIMSRMSRLVKE